MRRPTGRTYCIGIGYAGNHSEVYAAAATPFPFSLFPFPFPLISHGPLQFDVIMI